MVGVGGCAFTETPYFSENTMQMLRAGTGHPALCTQDGCGGMIPADNISQKHGRWRGLDILDIDVVRCDWPEAFERIDAAIEAGGQTVFAFLNANNANLAVRNPDFRRALQDSVVLPDGVGLDIAARALHGAAFPANLNGTDFIPALLTYVERPLTVAMIGATSTVLENARTEFARNTPWHRFVAVSDGYVGAAETPAVLDRLRALRPDILLVAMGSPRQELWIARYIRPEHGKVVFSVGGLFDFVSQSKPRAPRLLRMLRCEWVFRLALEPRRLWRRYLLGNPLFLFHVLRHKFRRHDAGKTPA